jgi:hypothetical protein
MPRPGSADALLRAAIGLFAVLALLVGQASVGFAGHDGSGLAWIEICGEEGTHYALVGGNETPEDCVCTDCRCTLAGVGLKAAPAPATWQAGGDAMAVRVQIARHEQIVPEAAEQYWAATRGPPEQKASVRMSSFFFQLISESRDRDTGMGANPCA